jgi:hypothetical protein
MLRNQLISGFQLLKLWLTKHPRLYWGIGLHVEDQAMLKAIDV